MTWHVNLVQCESSCMPKIPGLKQVGTQQCTPGDSPNGKIASGKAPDVKSVLDQTGSS